MTGLKFWHLMSVILMNDYFEEISWLQSSISTAKAHYIFIVSGDVFLFGNEIGFNKYVLTEFVLI